jgi:hypothetical protein
VEATPKIRKGKTKNIATASAVRTFLIAETLDLTLFFLYPLSSSP